MKNVVFIMSAGHSGSTLLGLILGSHSAGFSLGEFSTAARQTGEFDDRSFPNCGVCVDECEFWNKKVSYPLLSSYFRGGNRKNKVLYPLYAHLGSIRLNIYKHLFDWTGAETLIDASKAAWWVRRQLRPIWFWQNMTPFLLYLHRDGRAVANSNLRKYPDTDMAYFAKQWGKATLYRERYFNAFPKDRRLKVSYEALTTNPEEVVGSICHLLGISYESEMLRYWQHDHHLLGGNLGARLLIFNYREQFDSDLSEYWSEKNQNGKYSDQTYYEQVGLAIKTDLRWQHELDKDQLKIFDSIAGEINERLIAKNTPGLTNV